ncbi:MAG: methyltransferase domain-containing protein [Nanoarchaeota archaeon]|nr:methyltransferase domain-containing protein [Nanoarchaeota archaeon]
MVKTRGLEEAERKLGNLVEIISNLLKKKKKIKVFESGYGYGKVMSELKVRFGDKIEITGMNYKKSHGDKKKVVSFALKERIISKSNINKLNSIKVVFGDAGKKLPFKSGSIDLVYSQTSAYLYEDKMHFFEEVSRILSKDGIARITPPLFKENLPEEYKKILRIYIGNKEIEFKDFIKKFNKIKIIKLYGGKKVIEIKGGGIDFGLKLESVVNTNNLCKDWFGVVSVYTKKDI